MTVPIARPIVTVPNRPLTSYPPRESVDGKAGEAGSRKPLRANEIENECERVRREDSSSPSRTRTYNKPVNSRLLYH